MEKILLNTFYFQSMCSLKILILYFIYDSAKKHLLIFLKIKEKPKGKEITSRLRSFLFGVAPQFFFLYEHFEQINFLLLALSA